MAVFDFLNLRIFKPLALICGQSLSPTEVGPTQSMCGILCCTCAWIQSSCTLLMGLFGHYDSNRRARRISTSSWSNFEDHWTIVFCQYFSVLGGLFRLWITVAFFYQPKALARVRWSGSAKGSLTPPQFCLGNGIGINIGNEWHVWLPYSISISFRLTPSLEKKASKAAGWLVTHLSQY